MNAADVVKLPNITLEIITTGGKLVTIQLNLD
jgi:hypothetical protein